MQRGTKSHPKTTQPTAGRGESEATNPNRTARPRLGGRKEAARSARQPQPSGNGGPQARRRARRSAGPGRAGLLGQAPPSHCPHTAGARPAPGREARPGTPSPAPGRLREEARPGPARPRQLLLLLLRLPPPPAPQRGGPAPRPPHPHPGIPPRRACHGRGRSTEPHARRGSAPSAPIGRPAPQLGSHWAVCGKAGQQMRLTALCRVSGASPW